MKNIARRIGWGTTAVALCGAAACVALDSDADETTVVALVVALEPADAIGEPASCQHTDAPPAPGTALQLAVLRYHDGSRHARHWHTVRVSVAPGLHAGDMVRFDPMTCAVSPDR